VRAINIKEKIKTTWKNEKKHVNLINIAAFMILIGFIFSKPTTYVQDEFRLFGILVCSTVIWVNSVVVDIRHEITELKNTTPFLPGK
jgi:hypothetical protein